MASSYWHNFYWLEPVPGTGDPPDTPTLTLADNEDGTGAVATVAGSSAGSTNEVFVSSWPGSTFVSGGSRVSDGTVALSLSNGPHWAFVRSTINNQCTASDLVQFRTTDGTESVWYQCLVAVRDIIRGLSLVGFSSDDIVFQKLPWNRTVDSPGIVVSPTPEQIAPASNHRDDVGYGVQIVMIQAGNHDLESDVDAITLAREQISRALRGKALLGVDEVYTVRIEPGPIFDVPSFLNQYDVGALTARCISREPITIT